MRGRPRGSDPRRPTEEGSWLAPLAALAVGALCLLFLFAARSTPAPANQSAPDINAERLRERVDEEALFAVHWQQMTGNLCSDPVLQAEGIAADCRTGTITFGDDLFDEDEATQLTEEGIRKLHYAIDGLLRNLRAHPDVWERIESIELRGHADPRARRDPYVTNMRVSQQRPLAIMFYLISDWALSERDRDDLERLMILSAASYSRPPESCPDRNNECYSFWRRVEITPRLRGAQIVDEHRRFNQELSRIAGEPS
ncbi:MAG: hypothetical protein CBC48_03255 [bacterium TMED88]|nr:hypothetical protein [Deltaproteobacteria bacterium]OUV35743.1 MAG: hypothetical protein CBC48_03255 [bacterium TMED88]